MPHTLSNWDILVSKN